MSIFNDGGDIEFNEDNLNKITKKCNIFMKNRKTYTL